MEKKIIIFFFFFFSWDSVLRYCCYDSRIEIGQGRIEPSDELLYLPLSDNREERTGLPFWFQYNHPRVPNPIKWAPWRPTASINMQLENKRTLWIRMGPGRGGDIRLWEGEKQIKGGWKRSVQKKKGVKTGGVKGEEGGLAGGAD